MSHGCVKKKILLLNIGIGYHPLPIYLKVRPKLLLEQQEEVIKYEKKIFFFSFPVQLPTSSITSLEGHHPFGANFSKEVSNWNPWELCQGRCVGHYIIIYYFWKTIFSLQKKSSLEWENQMTLDKYAIINTLSYFQFRVYFKFIFSSDLSNSFSVYAFRSRINYASLTDIPKFLSKYLWTSIWQELTFH